MSALCRHGLPLGVVCGVERLLSALHVVTLARDDRAVPARIGGCHFSETAACRRPRLGGGPLASALAEKRSAPPRAKNDTLDILEVCWLQSVRADSYCRSDLR